MAETELSIPEASERCGEILDAIESVVIARREFLENVLLGILADGHVLLEDVPGTGKTLTANTFATVLGLSFSRVQFTPDLLPSDIVGTNIYNEQDRSFEFNEGPVFANVVLGDEINRAPPKTQAAMLETMGEQQVTVEGKTRQLPQPFFVIATQNPVEQEGTFPLPEAQVDRFMVKDTLGYPDQEGVVELLERRSARRESTPSTEPVLDSIEEVRALREVPETVTVHDDMLTYMADIMQRTREDNRVRVGVSPRGIQRLFEAVRARAVITGREYATPDDVKEIAGPVLAHRIVLTAEAQVNEVETREVVEDVLDDIPVPTVQWEAEA